MDGESEMASPGAAAVYGVISIMRVITSRQIAPRLLRMQGAPATAAHGGPAGPHERRTPAAAAHTHGRGVPHGEW